MLVSALFGLLRGLLREALSLATWIAAVWLAWALAPAVEPLIGMDSPMARLWIARALVFVAVVALGALTGHFVAALIRGSVLSGADRGLGALFGLARGALLVAVVVVVAQAVVPQPGRWWTESRVAPYGLAVAAWVRGLFDGPAEARPPQETRAARRAA